MSPRQYEQQSTVHQKGIGCLPLLIVRLSLEGQSQETFWNGSQHIIRFCHTQ
jgi:hypothetical protein